MFDILLTAIIISIYGIIAVFGIDASDDTGKRFMSIDYTNTMKGLCCIIVVFVHIMPAYQNKMQDAVGSFAYICVTIFMLFSGYGIAYGMSHKELFFKKFIPHRLMAVFVPFAISVAVKSVFKFNPLSGGTGYIWVLLLFYLVAFFAYAITKNSGGGIMETCCLRICNFVQHSWEDWLHIRMAC